MAYESSIPFADIRDFREAEINGISALFTMCRLGAAISSGSFRWLWQTSPERSSPGSPCSGKDRRTLKYAGTASMTRRQSTNGLKTTTITLKHYATKIQTEGQLYLQRLFYPACGFRQGGRTSCFRTMRNGSECDSNDSRRRIRGRLAFRQTSPACNPGSNRSSGDPRRRGAAARAGLSPDYEMSGCCVVCSGNDDKETPSDKDLILICCSDSETEVYPCELRSISDNH